MPENSIYQLTGKIESDIRQSYSGGAVDVYIPHNRLSSFFNNVKTIFLYLFVNVSNINLELQITRIYIA